MCSYRTTQTHTQRDSSKWFIKESTRGTAILSKEDRKQLQQFNEIQSVDSLLGLEGEAVNDRLEIEGKCQLEY